MDTNIHVRKKDKGYQYIVSYKVNGIWKQKSKQGFAKASEAKKEAQIVEREISERYNIATSECSYTFEYVANMKMLEGNLSAGTIESQKYALKRYSAIAKKNMEDITYLDILEILKEAKEKYKYSTFYGMYEYGKSVFDYGIKKLKLPRYNPFEEYNIIPPKKSDAKAKQALTSSQLADLI